MNHRQYALCRDESGVRLIVSHRITPSSIVFYGAPRVIKPCDPGSAAPCCPNPSTPVGCGYTALLRKANRKGVWYNTAANVQAGVWLMECAMHDWETLP